ncbi:2-hydroxy-3-oxopropionate reductase [Posidoniimonas polymericola]|uniref:2-hydroxy-3-oxopropionate reductase n=1 Tax=Posidoniimonas polymericola TaxID=2528002 RepID=A0A5C5ZF88_9BACT|nr:NAD(P)-dependent oxidoreductase [Posidoniimonas polymericola]TWT85992.1 2-hydroxy-3-oxopropionate reductase [Posidoniimonas polymericola]
MNPTQNNPVGVIGLGLLGSALAERLVGAGFEVRVWNRSREKAAELLKLGAKWSDNPLAECSRVVVCLYTTEVVEQVLQTMVPAMQPGGTIVDCTTGDPVGSARLGERLAGQGVGYLESPIAASSEQTRRGQALAIVGGPREVFDAQQDIFAAIAGQTHYVGGWGAAAKVKLVNNLILGLNRAVLAEGLVFAERVGLDPRTTLEVLRQGNAYSGVMDTKGAKMVDGDFAVQARLSQHAKDIRIVLDQASQHGARLPLTELHLELLALGERLGFGEDDNSSIIRAVQHAAAQSEAIGS